MRSLSMSAALAQSTKLKGMSLYVLSNSSARDLDTGSRLRTGIRLAATPSTKASVRPWFLREQFRYVIVS